MSTNRATSPHRLDSWGALEFREVLGTFSTGVAVVATGGEEPVGMTTNSFASVSVDPPLVLFCARKGSRIHGRLDRGCTFSVSVLTAAQEQVARHFASSSRGTGLASFEDVAWHWGRQVPAPLLSEAAATLECQVWQTHDGGDHTIYIGEVLALSRQDEQVAPLVFLEGRYSSVARAAATPTPRRSELMNGAGHAH